MPHNDIQRGVTEGAAAALQPHRSGAFWLLKEVRTNLERIPGAARWVVIFKGHPRVRRACAIEGVWLNSGHDASSTARDELLGEDISHRRQPPVVDELNSVASLQHCS